MYKRNVACLDEISGWVLIHLGFASVATSILLQLLNNCYCLSHAILSSFYLELFVAPNLLPH